MAIWSSTAVIAGISAENWNGRGLTSQGGAPNGRRGWLSASLAPGGSLLSDFFSNPLSGSDRAASTVNAILVSVVSDLPQSATMDNATNALVWSSAGRSLEPALADPIASIKDKLLTFTIDESVDVSEAISSSGTPSSQNSSLVTST